jgi:hypothetical protein
MKLLAKIFKALLIIVLSVVALVYGGVFLGHKVIFKEPESKVPTIQPATDGTMTLGLQPDQPVTVEGYIDVLAAQLKRYNEIAPSLWPDSAVTNQSIILEELNSQRFWLISPDGAVTVLQEDEALAYGFYRSNYFGGFDPYDGGMYLAVAESDLTNYLLFEKYLHVGTYDAFITFTHESFHMKEQAKWAMPDSVPNEAREEFLDNGDARAKRALLQRQLLKAISGRADRQLILEAVATYEDYKTGFPDDYNYSVFTDRDEGTAYYYELISSLYAAYPAQVNSREDLYRALELLATREDIYVDTGLVAEGYNVGGFACILMDMLGYDWKERIMNDADATPIEMLAESVSGETLPPPARLTQEEIDAVSERINEMEKGGGPSLLFKFLYELLF